MKNEDLCQSTQLVLLSGEELLQEAQQHLQQCPACRDFARDFAALSSTAQPSPSAALELRTIRACHAALAERRVRRSSRTRHWLAAAAALILTALIGVLALPAWHRSTAAGSVVASSAGNSESTPNSSEELFLETELSLASSNLDEMNLELVLIASDCW